MLTGVINESMFENNQMQKEEKRILHEMMRERLGQQCADLFENLPTDEAGEVDVEDVKSIAHDVIFLIEASGSNIAEGDIIKLIEHMDMDCSGTINMIEFVHAVEKIAEGVSPMVLMELQHSVADCQVKLMAEHKFLTASLAVLDKRSVDSLTVLGEIERSVKRLDQRDGGAETMIQRMAEMQKSVQILSDQMGANESRVQFAVSSQVGEMGKSVQSQVGEIVTSVQRLLDTNRDQKADGSEIRLQFARGQQIEDIQRSVHTLLEGKEIGRDYRISSRIEMMETSLQRMHDQMNANDAQGIVSQRVTDTQKSVDRLVEKDTSDSLSRLAMSSQVQAIGTSMQKLLHLNDGRGAQSSQQNEEMRLVVQRHFDSSQQGSEARIQQLQKQVDAAQSSLLGGMAELGGVVLDGVGDVLSQKMAAMQMTLLRELASSQEFALRKLVAVRPPEASA